MLLIAVALTDFRKSQDLGNYPVSKPSSQRIAKRTMHNTWRQVDPARLEEIKKRLAADAIPKVISKPKGKVYRTASGKLFQSERQVFQGCIEVLEAHPYVALWWRQNTGAFKSGNRYVKFSFKGASDLMAVLRGGRFLAVECKATGKTPSPDQRAFLDNVVDCGGASVCADDPAKLKNWLDGLWAISKAAQSVQEPGK